MAEINHSGGKKQIFLVVVNTGKDLAFLIPNVDLSPFRVFQNSFL